MGYTSRRGRRPNEYASKSAHGHVINDPAMQDFLAHCSLPKRASEVKLSEHLSVPFEPALDNPIQHVIAVDGGYNEVVVQKEFPSATVCFFQFGRWSSAWPTWSSWTNSRSSTRMTSPS